MQRDDDVAPHGFCQPPPPLGKALEQWVTGDVVRKVDLEVRTLRRGIMRQIGFDHILDIVLRPGDAALLGIPGFERIHGGSLLSYLKPRQIGIELLLILLSL
ncbi:hypothetical protein AAAX65_07360 [Alistipes finegoldii]